MNYTLKNRRLRRRQRDVEPAFLSTAPRVWDARTFLSPEEQQVALREVMRSPAYTLTKQENADGTVAWAYTLNGWPPTPKC